MTLEHRAEDVEAGDGIDGSTTLTRLDPEKSRWRAPDYVTNFRRLIVLIRKRIKRMLKTLSLKKPKGD